jgi:hypothetical protein
MTEILANINKLNDEFGNIYTKGSEFEQYKKVYKLIQKISIELPMYYNQIGISNIKIEPLQKATVKKLKEDYEAKNYHMALQKLYELAFITPVFVKRNNKLNRILNDEQGQIWEVSQEMINQLRSTLGFR